MNFRSYFTSSLLFPSLVFIPAIIFGIEIDPLPSWNEGTAKNAIIDFVQTVSSLDSFEYVPPENRIAVFDLDGTLWCEKPLAPQAAFLVERAKTLSLSMIRNPIKAINQILKMNIGDLTKLNGEQIASIAIPLEIGVSLDDYQLAASSWLIDAIHPDKKLPYSSLTYQPMKEVIELFKQYSFDVYIVSGSGQEFIRIFSDNLFSIPRENVIGTIGQLRYKEKNGSSILEFNGEILHKNDKDGKVKGIQWLIGKRPIAAFGNSDGDRDMLSFVTNGAGKHLLMLIHHDDENREYAYDNNTFNGRLSNEVMHEAKNRDWLLTSMKNDWKAVFPNKN